MKLHPDSQDRRVDLYGIDVTGAHAEGHSDIVACAGSDDGHAFRVRMNAVRKSVVRCGIFR
jgi:hypothetical protein